MSEVDGQIGELHSALKDLRKAFARTEDHWRDSSRDEFYALYIEALEQEWNQAAKTISHISSVLTQVRTDCSS